MAEGGGSDQRSLESREAEEHVLGALLQKNDAWDLLQGVVTEQDFRFEDLKAVYRTIETLLRARSPADVLTVTEYMKVHCGAALEALGGMRGVHDLVAVTPGAANIKAYAEIVHDRATLRRILSVARWAEAEVKESGRAPAKDVLESVLERFAGISTLNVHGRGELKPIGAALAVALEELESAFRNKDTAGVGSVPTGFSDLDEKIAGGFKPGQLIVIAGRPGMGKTAIALNIARYIALKKALPVGVFSMEMEDTELIKRLLADLANLHGLRMAHGRFSEQEWADIGDAAPVLHGAPLYICKDGYLTISELIAGARKMKREAGGVLGLLVVDYLGLMKIERPSSNRAQDIAEISRGLKALAKELRVPIVLLAQLNREVEKRGDKRPVLSDLRDSGEIEADADIVLMLYRADVYQDLPDDQKGTAEVLIRKQRSGPTGVVHLRYDAARTRFSDRDPFS